MHGAYKIYTDTHYIGLLHFSKALCHVVGRGVKCPAATHVIHIRATRTTVKLGHASSNSWIAVPVALTTQHSLLWGSTARSFGVSTVIQGKVLVMPVESLSLSWLHLNSCTQHSPGNVCLGGGGKAGSPLKCLATPVLPQNLSQSLMSL